LVEKSGRKKYMQRGVEEAPENGKLIVAFCAWQWNKYIWN
jgi:hypothetical protein